MEDSLHIQHLVLQSGGGRAAADRLRIERLLGTVDLRPPELPPSAVLIVRQMQDPLPGKLATNQKVSWVNREWERQAREQLAELYRQAARPAYQVVPSGAQAVLFLDEGELLECLALDICQGQVQAHWWWQFALGKAARLGLHAQALVERMVRQPPAAVSAIAWLASRGRAEEVLLALLPNQAGVVLRAVAGAFKLTAVEFSPASSSKLSGLSKAAPPPWETAPAPPGFGRERAALLGLAIDLARRPEAVRSQAYQRQVSDWWQATGIEGIGHPPSGETPLRSVFPAAIEGTRDGSIAKDHADDPRQGSTGRLPEAETKSVSMPAELRKLQEIIPKANTDPRGQELQPGPAFVAQQSSQPNPDGKRMESEPIEQPAESASTPSQVDSQKKVTPDAADERLLVASQAVANLLEEVQPAAEESLANGISTELGGVLYLINMMAVLDLPECFESGWLLASQVGAWGTLEALGRELLGDEYPARREDPLWTALRSFDGRPAQEPPGFRLPWRRPRRIPDFNFPPRWLDGLPKLHLRPLTRAWQRSIRQAYPPFLAGWLVCVLPFLDARLRLALRLSPRASLPQALLLVPGRIYFTSSNLDLIISLEAISLRARMAGLDCDPGWVPEFGRFFRFHFE